MKKITLRRYELKTLGDCLSEFKTDDKIFDYYIEKNKRLIDIEYGCLTHLLDSNNKTDRYNRFVFEKIKFENGTNKNVEDYKKLAVKYIGDTSKYDIYVNNLTVLVKEDVEIDIEPIPFKYFIDMKPLNFEVLSVLIEENIHDLIDIYGGQNG